MVLTYRRSFASCRLVAFAALASLIAAVGPSAGQALAPEDGAKVMARVNGEPLYAEDLERVLAELHKGQEIQSRSVFDLDQLMFRLVNDALLAQEARALGLDESEEIRRKVEQRRESKARTRLYREEIVERIDTGEEKVRAAYDDVFRIATLRIVSRRDRAEAEALVPRVVAARDAESFAALAREASQDQYAPRGGKVETALTNLYKTMSDYAATAAPGEVSPPLATPWGWTVARLEALVPADPALLAERRGRTLVELRQRQEATLRADLVSRLEATVGFEIDAEVFASVGVQRMHDGRLLPQFEGPERVVATVLGRAITAADFAGKLASAWSGVSNPDLALDYRRAVLDQLIFQEMLVAEGLRRGYGDTPEVKRELHALEMNLLATRYLKEIVAADVEVDREAMQSYYESHRDEFRKPPLVHQLQLTAATREEAERLAELARGGADFGWLVRQHSTDRFREAGGDRGWVAANEASGHFREEIARAVAGEVYGPKEGPEGWVVLKVDLVEDRGHYPFEAVSGNVRERVQGVKIFERIDMVIQRLRERAEIWIDEQAVAAMQIVPTAPEEASTMPGHEGG